MAPRRFDVDRVGFPFPGIRWLVAKVAWSTPVIPLVTFVLSVSATILVALLLDMDQGDTLDLRMWLTVPLFLVVAPATAIAVGGFVAATRGAQNRRPSQFSPWQDPRPD